MALNDENAQPAEGVAQRGHLLTVTKSEDWTEDDPCWGWSIACLVPEKCGGWWECEKEHRLEGIGVADISAVDGPYENDCPGWHGPYTGDAVYDIAYDHGEGVHVVDDEWDDTDLTLIYVSTEP